MNPTATSYVIGCMTLGSPAAVQSDEGEYKGCLAAVDGITHICDVEEKYENLIENYIEWESAIGRYALRQMVSFEFEFNDIQTARKLAARKLANLLASARLYLDSLPKHIKSILPGNYGVLAQIKEATSVQYDSRLSYRFMEALRNYSQHSALPIHGVTTSAMREELTKGTTTLNFSVLPNVDHAQLAQDDNFKKSVLNEITKLESIELKPMVREYIESLSTVQKVFRMVTDPKRKAWQDRLHATANRFREQFPNEPTTALAVLPVDADGVKFGDAVFVLGPMVEYLEHMQLKYMTMVDFSKRKIDF